MSFRGRLTLFFVLIVIVPMVSLTFVLFRLISDNETGKADARIAARQQVAIGFYEDARDRADAAATAIGGDPELAAALRAGDRRAAQDRAGELLAARDLKRIVVVRDGATVVDVGTPRAAFPAVRRLVDADGDAFGQLEVSAEGPRRYAELIKRLTGLEVVVRRGGETLAATLPAAGGAALPASGREDVDLGGETYRTTSFSPPEALGARSQVTLLEPRAAVAEDIRDARLLASGILLGFFVLAFAFAVLVSRSLQRQIAGFLEAARRLGRGDFSAKVPTAGRDEFAALGHEFNAMSDELAARLAELREERARLETAMRRVGETFASNLDRDALLEIVLRTALDGAGATGGRATLPDEQGLDAVTAAGDLDGLQDALAAAESAVLDAGAPREATVGDVTALAHPLRASAATAEVDGSPALLGVVAVARAGHPFAPAERELFHYLAGQAAVSLENVGLHETVERQATLDELTSLANRRVFTETLATEAERSRRFGQPLGLVMLDIDDFKRVNDTYGHQAGDLVLREVGRILRETAREIDLPARYGGEELATVLPGTDLEGAYELAERVRRGIEELRLPVQTADGTPLRVTASFGAATVPVSALDATALIAAADAALYEAKRTGKNRTVRAAALSQA